MPPQLDSGLGPGEGVLHAAPWEGLAPGRHLSKSGSHCAVVFANGTVIGKLCWENKPLWSRLIKLLQGVLGKAALPRLEVSGSTGMRETLGRGGILSELKDAREFSPKQGEKWGGVRAWPNSPGSYTGPFSPGSVCAALISLFKEKPEVGVAGTCLPSFIIFPFTYTPSPILQCS